VTNYILRIKEQETRLNLHENDDDDDDVPSDSLKRSAYLFIYLYIYLSILGPPNLFSLVNIFTFYLCIYSFTYLFYTRQNYSYLAIIYKGVATAPIV